jgi:GntR family transcriptional regulator
MRTPVHRRNGADRPTGGKSGFVRDELLTMVEDLEVGDAIPAERKLAGDLGVSRPTLRAGCCAGTARARLSPSPRSRCR